jgi:hypothetical protein
MEPPPILPPKANAPHPRRKNRKKLMVFILADNRSTSD